MRNSRSWLSDLYEWWICRENEEQMHSYTDNKILCYSSLISVTQAQEHKPYSTSLYSIITPMDRTMLGSVPVQCNICTGQLQPFCRAMFRFFLWVFLIFFFYISLQGRILNINLGICRLHWEFNSGSVCV